MIDSDIHLIRMNPVGGIAGDMFIAAVLDMFPELEEPMLCVLHDVDQTAAVKSQLQAHHDTVLTGKKFSVVEPDEPSGHTTYRELRDVLMRSRLELNVKSNALRILDRLGEAEANVHGIDIEKVHLHEAGSIDSLTDIVCAAFLISALKDVRWCCDPIPLGSGMINTAHGQMPLPAPAVALLLEEFPVYDDGRKGERVTPTGAAILKTLQPDFTGLFEPMILSATGIGFGNSTFDDMSNILRLIGYRNRHDLSAQSIGMLNFEIDDQTAEDLSIGLERIRQSDGVLDVIQIPAMGKKGRITVHVQVLCVSSFISEIANVCINETSTLGVRYQLIDRYIAQRTLKKIDIDDTEVAVKLTRRPDGATTAKAEANAVEKAGRYSKRKRLKQASEQVSESSDGRVSDPE